MSEIKVNKISPRTACGTTTLGDSGDTFTIPSGVSITNQGTASGFGSTGEVSWVTTKKTTGFTVTAGEGYFCDTSSGGFTVTLPAGTAGNSFAVADYTNTFQTGNLTISPNGTNKIGGVNADVTLSTEGQSAYFVYVDDTEGWKNVIDSTSNLIGNAFISATGGTITTSGNDRIHTFTGPGTFAVSSIATCAPNNVVSYMVVAGGGGGSSGGGGAGGFREFKSPVTPYTASPLEGSTPITVTAASFPVTVGGGGAGNACGNNSVFAAASTITSAGGGKGGAFPNSPGTQGGANGGSGGGGGGGPNPGTGSAPGGTGNTPPVSPPQGNNGGAGRHVCGAYFGSGGGGGATAVGASKTGAQGDTPFGNGGAGATTSINGSPTAFAGGGGAKDDFCTGGTGGTGGGGNAGNTGTANTGGGGGGDVAGGSGIVIIRYKFQ